jgi:hypothetical protein
VKVTVPGLWVTVMAWSATVTVARRVVTLEGFGVAVIVTLPRPMPRVSFRVSHKWPLDAVHSASASDGMTVTDCDPPVAGAVHVVGVTLKVAVPAAWVTVMM